MKLPPFEYACPSSLSEAVALLAAHDGEAKAIAGGQSLVPMMAFRVAQPALLVDLRKLSDLRGIRIGTDGVRLGALARWRDIQDDKRLATAHPLLQAAIAHVAHYQIRNRGTVGGSLAHADPAAEMPGIAVTCGTTRLSEVRICLSRDLKFRDCAEVDRRACRRDKLLMPPVRPS